MRQEKLAPLLGEPETDFVSSKNTQENCFAAGSLSNKMKNKRILTRRHIRSSYLHHKLKLIPRSFSLVRVLSLYEGSLNKQFSTPTHELQFLGKFWRSLA